MNYKQRVDEAIQEETVNVSFLSQLPDTKLERKLASVREQMQLANGNSQALELLKTWERQIIEARVIKHEQQPELNELSEIEMELAEMEAMEKVFDERMQVLNRNQAPVTDNREEQNEVLEEEVENKPQPIEINQLKLF